MATTEPQKPARSSQDLSAPPWEALLPGTAEALRPGLDRTADEVIEAIRTAVPAYARPLEGRFGEGIRTGVIRALEGFVSAAEGRPQRPSRGWDIYFELGRGEVREGRPLEALLSAYRIGARVAWRHAAAGARQAGLGADALAPLAEAMFAFIDELSARSAEGFAYEQSVVAGEAAGRRRALVQLMVARPPSEPAAVEDAARDAGWRLPDDARGAGLARRPGRAPGRRAAVRLAHRACARRHRVRARARRPRARAPGGAHPLVRRRDRRPGPGRPLDGDLAERRRAAAALGLAARGPAPGGRPGASRTGTCAELALLRDRRLLEDLAASTLAPLDGRTPGARARLLETLRGWIDHQGRVPDVARALHVHPQTVRYRLTQLREAFGPALDDPDGRFALALAVRAPGAAEARAGVPQETSRRRPVSTS